MHESQSNSDPAGDVITVELLPARQGDSLLVQWPGQGRVVTMLVDAGPVSAYAGIARRLAELPGRRIDYLVLTHVDGDHIEGIIRLVNDSELSLCIGEIWFNGRRHLPQKLKPLHGEMLTALIQARKIPWNATFGGPTQAVRSPDQGALVAHELQGGVRATVLAPDGEALRRLRDVWDQACVEAKITAGSTRDGLRVLHDRPALVPGRRILSLTGRKASEPTRDRLGRDTSLTNASSIVVLLEWGQEQRVLLAGDSTPGVLGPALDRLLRERGCDRLPLSDFKLPHHGSKNNISPHIVAAVPSQRYLVSTDGSGRSRHPDEAAIKTILEHGPAELELVFNFDSPRNRQWSDETRTQERKLRVSFPTPAAEQPSDTP